MATLVESGDFESSLGSASNTMASLTNSNLSQHFVDNKFYLLVVIGEIVSEDHLKCAIADIEKGIRSWDTNLIDCNLDQELKLFVSRHSARFSADVRGQRILHHKSSVLETVVLINPSDEAVSTEARLMVSDPARHKLLVLAGQCFENTGELILQAGSFSFHNFIDIFTDQEIGELLSTIHPAHKANLTLYCPEQGDWKNSNLDKHNLQDFIHMKINSTLILPEMEGLSEFTEYLSESVEIPSPFDMLEPPTSGGFLKLSKPCCYIFPGGHGDSALFAVNGFNMLINGGSDRKSCFWKLVRHLDRVDSVLLTHVGDDNLPGINSMLLRKTTEQEEERSQGSTGTGDCVKNMISPDVGVVFVNLPENLLAPEPDFRLRRNAEEAATTQQLLSKLNLRVEPLQRPAGNALEPIILFQKMGVGKLEMYVLSPSKNSKELQHFMKQWTGGEDDKTTILMPNGKETELPVSYLTSISSLIVWHPANPAEKIVRVLFPGNATQNHILEGLEKLKHLDFLKRPVVTQKELSSSAAPALKQAKLSGRTDSKESLKSKASPNRSVRKESKEEASEKAKGDAAEKAQEKSLKAEKKEKAPVRKEKAKAPEKEVKLKAEQTPQNETPEKKKTEIKPKLQKEKVVKREPKKSLVEKKSEEKEVKKEVALKKDEKLAPKKEEKIKKEEKVKKVEVKKDIKKDFRRDSPLRERKEEKKEQKKEADSKKEAKKPSKDVTKASAVGEGRKPAPKPKTVKRDDASKKDTATLPKSKDKPKSKVTKKAAVAVATAAAGGVAAAAEALETQRSTMSSPEDLTKDFEALKAEETTEGDDVAAVPRHIQKEGQEEEEEEEEAVMIHREDVMLSKESPEAAESVDEGITTTEPEGDSGETPEEAFPRGKISGSGSEKFEDEGTEQDYEEKGETEEVDEPTRSTEEADTFRQEVGGARKDRGRCDEDLDATQKKQGAAAAAPPKVSSPVSPAASIHDETLPTGYDSEGPSDEEEDNRDEANSGHTQSTMEISSVPTPMDEMSTPRDLMSDENTTNDETEESPSQDFGRPGASPPLGELDRKRLSPLRDGPESDRSKSDATEGRDYHASASTISPPSSAEEDRPCQGFDFDMKDEGGFRSFDAARLGPDADSFPLVRSPSGDQRKAFDSHTVFTAPVELYTTMAGYPRSNMAAETSHSPGSEEGETARSPRSSGHTPYYQSPVEEKAGAIPPLSGANSEGPIIVEVTSDREEGSTSRGVCPVEKPGHESWSAGEKTTKSPPHHDEKKNGSGNNNNNNSSSSSGHHFAPPTRHESDGINPFTGASKEESKMSISEGNTTTSDKSGGTPVDEVVAEDTFSHLASASTASLATSSFPEPATDSRSLHAEVGSPHSTEVDDSLSVSVVQTPTTFQEVEEEEGSPAHEEYSPRPMSISPDVSPKSKSMVQSEQKSPEQSTISAEFGQESPDHSLALDFSKRSPEQPRGATENGPTEVDYSPSESGEVRPRPEKPTLFRDGDAARAALSASPSDASQSTPSVSTPCQMKGLDGKSPTTPRVASLSHSPVSPDSSPVLGGAGGGGDKSSSQATETNPFKSGEHSPSSASSTTAALQFTSSSGPKIPSPSYLPLSSNLSAGDSRDPSSSSSKKTPSPHSRTDVDLCLVTSCEYRHPKTELSPSFINPSPLEYFLNEENQEEQKPMAKSGAGGGAPPPGGKLHPKQCEETPPTSVSESAPSQTDSDVPPGTEECPSITADANIDSEDDSETLPTDRTLTYRHAAADPPPVVPRDPAPPPPHSDVCMVDPETLKALERKEDEKAAEGGEKAKVKKMAKKSSSPARKTVLSKVKDTKTASPKKVAGEGKDAKNATNTSASRGVKSATSGLANGKTSGAASVPNCPPMYMDLVYIPNHCSAKNVDAEFFKRVRSSFYVVSGNDPAAQEPSKVVLDSLLEGKAQWGNNMQVTLIPTHDTEVMRDWYQETHDQQQELNIMVLASSSTVVMQDESFPACKIEL